jgi:hypothetical protein
MNVTRIQHDPDLIFILLQEEFEKSALLAYLERAANI